MSSVVKEVVLSLSRNIEEYPFTHILDKDKKIEIAEKVAISLDKYSIKFSKYILSEMERVDILSLFEKFYILSSYADNNEGRYLFVSEDESLALITNGENHIKILAKENGLLLNDAYSKANELDDYLSETFNFAFSKEYGYLSPNISMLGNGLKASTILHLPALSSSKGLQKIASNLSKLGLLLKPLYGDGFNTYSDIYSLSNTVTLGITEEAAIDNLKNITEQLANQETKAREQLVGKIEVQDKIYRALGILKNARIIGYSEAMNLLSLVRFGASMDLLEIDVDNIDELIFEIQPVNILKSFDDIDDVDITRAEIIRSKI